MSNIRSKPSPPTMGSRRHYRLDAAPLGVGGFAEVFRAVHRDTGTVLAYKRLQRGLRRNEEARARLEREIQTQQALASCPGIMPVLDAGGDDPVGGLWYTMPLATGHLEQLHTLPIPTEALVPILQQIAHGLAATHARDYVHRDVTVRNILALDQDQDGRCWVLADFGLVRKPVGSITVRYTRTGVRLGTEGFIAPELLGDAHEQATPTSDIYSLGRVAAWAVTGQWPVPGVRLLPDGGPWRGLVSRATHERPERRIQNAADFLAELDEVTYLPAEDAVDKALQARARLLGASNASERDSAAADLLGLALEHPDDAIIYFDCLGHARGQSLAELVATRPADAAELLDRLHGHLLDGHTLTPTWYQRTFDAWTPPLLWLLEIARHAAMHGQEGLLEDAADALFGVAPSANRYEERHATRNWLNELTGDAASAVARALRRHPSAVLWYLDEGWQPSPYAHYAIKDSLQP